MLSCREGVQTNTVTLDMDAALGDSTALPIKAISTDVRLVPLETDEAALISYISDVIIAGDRLVVIHDRKSSVFDNDGHFLNDIGRRGEGPEEYLSIGNCFIKDGLLYLFDGDRHRLMKYSLSGKFVEAVNTPEKVESVYPLTNSVYDGYISNMSGVEPVRFYLLNEAGETVDSIPYSQSYGKAKVQSWFYALEANIYKDDKGVTCLKELYCDTVYRMDKAYNFIPKYILGYGANGLKPEERYQLQDPMVNPLAGKQYSAGILESSRYLFIKGGGTAYGKTVLLDKATRKLRHVALRFEEAEAKLFGKTDLTPYFMSPDNTTLISYETPLPGDNADEDNPTIILVKLNS
jgi:hypothetical protein